MLFPGGFFLMFRILFLLGKKNKYFLSRYTEEIADLIYFIIGDFLQIILLMMHSPLFTQALVQLSPEPSCSMKSKFKRIQQDVFLRIY